MVDETIKRLVVFSILMENNEGIKFKSPSYIIEKYHSSMKVPYPESLLDRGNKAKFNEWINTWDK